MRHVLSKIAALGMILFATAFPASAQDGAPPVVLALPFEGRFAPVSQQIETGLKAALGGQFAKTIKRIDDGCDPKKADETAKKIIETQARLVVGLICFDTARDIARALKKSQGDAAPTVLTTGTRNAQLDRLRTVEKLKIYEFSNQPDGEALAIIDQIVPQFDGKPYAVLDDGSVYGRGLSDEIRLKAAERGTPPITSANFRPLQTNQIAVLRRLRNSGVEALFVAASAEDVVTIARDMQTLGLNWPLATGERGALLRFTPGSDALPTGMMMVMPDMPKLAPDHPLSQAVRKTEGDIENAHFLGYALGEILKQNSRGGNLTGKSYQTIFGPMTFSQSGRAVPSQFKLFLRQGGTFTVQKPN